MNLIDYQTTLNRKENILIFNTEGGRSLIAKTFILWNNFFFFN